MLLPQLTFEEPFFTSQISVFKGHTQPYWSNYKINCISVVQKLCGISPHNSGIPFIKSLREYTGLLKQYFEKISKLGISELGSSQRVPFTIMPQGKQIYLTVHICVCIKKREIMTKRSKKISSCSEINIIIFSKSYFIF